jgi:RecJ-like exonuclease
MKKIIKCEYCNGSGEIELEEFCEKCGNVEITGEHKGEMLCMDCFLNSFSKQEREKMVKRLKGKSLQT